MTQQNYRASRLLWFSALLVGLSGGLLAFAVAQLPPSELRAASIETHEQEPSPEPPDPVTATYPKASYSHFVATAYSLRGTTASGVNVNTGIVAADPEVLPIGSVIELKVGSHTGIYTVLDTGALIKGKRIDIYLPNLDEALEFGRRAVKVRVLRHGWRIPSPTSFG